MSANNETSTPETTTTTYTVVVKTSDDYESAGTESKIEMKLVGEHRGEEDTTNWIELTSENTYGTGSRITYVLYNIKDVGIPSVVRLQITPEDEEEKDPWALDYVIVAKGEESKTFPVYTFISGRVNIIEGDTQLPQNVTTPLVRQYRRENLERMRELVQWAKEPGTLSEQEIEEGSQVEATSGLMRYANAKDVQNLPLFMQRSTKREHEFTRNTGVGVLTTAASILGVQAASFLSCLIGCGDISRTPECLDDYHRYHRILDVLPWEEQTRHFLKDWDTDDSFCWQMLNGMLPFGFKKVVDNLEEYPIDVTDEDLSGLLATGDNIQTAIDAGKLYIIDYSKIYAEESNLKYTVHKLGPYKGEHCQVAPASALFYVKDDKFVILAIQLKPNDRKYLFIAPKSDDEQTEQAKYSWLLAKMYFRNAGFSVHEWVYHFLYTHATVEVFQVAAYRTLSSAHPVYKLLRPHISTVAAINAGARNDLIPKDSLPAPGISVTAASMVSLFYKEYFSYDNLTVPKALEKHGVIPDDIPNYFYGQDTLILWDKVRKYVDGVLNVFYHSKQDVVDDCEVQNFAHEFAFEGFGWEGGDTKGMPEKFDTLEELVDLCTFVICTSSVQHAAVNFGQWETGKFVPNCPSIMNQPPHSNEDEIDEARVLKCLPKPKQVAGVLGVLYGLTTNSSVEKYLGDFSAEEWFFEDRAKEEQKLFAEGLQILDGELKKRNRKSDRKYVHQMPKNIPNSIAI